MKYSFDELSWLRFSDYYATWNKFFYLANQKRVNCKLLLLPSFRFYSFRLNSKNKHVSSKRRLNSDPSPKVLYLPTGYYPVRYQFNSSYPYAKGSNWEIMQCKFLNNLRLDKVNIICRDYHLTKSRINKYFTYRKL